MSNITPSEEITDLFETCNAKDAHWILLLGFAQAIDQGEDIPRACSLYVSRCIHRLNKGDDARKVFPSSNEEGRPRDTVERVEMARFVTRFLKNSPDSSLDAAFSAASVEFNKSKSAIRSVYSSKVVRVVAEAFEDYVHHSVKGRPRLKEKRRKPR